MNCQNISSCTNVSRATSQQSLRQYLQFIRKQIGKEKYVTKSPTKGIYICVEIPSNNFFHKISNKLTRIVNFQLKIRNQTKEFWNLFEIEVIETQTK